MLPLSQDDDYELRELAGRVDREASVAELGRRALTGSPIGELLELAVTDAARMLDSDVAVLMAVADSLSCEAWAGSAPPPEPALLDEHSHPAYVCLEQEVTLVSDLASDDRFPESRRLLEAGFTSAVGVPIRGGVDRALGVLAGWTRGSATFAAGDVLYLRSLANILAAAIARGRAESAIRRLQAVTAELAEARTSTEITRAIVSSGAESVGAAAGWVAELSASGEVLEHRASFGYDQDKIEGYTSIGVDEHNPTTDALSRRAPLYFHSAAECRATYPNLSYTRFEAMAVVPVVIGQEAVGVLALNFAEKRAFDGEEQRQLDALAKLYAQSLERARLYEREQTASRTLQLGLLGGELPRCQAAELAAAYRPGTVTNEVGGDWFDSFVLPDEKLAVLVGDVVGHDLEAAVTMGQLRGAVRALAPLGTPSALIERLDGFVTAFTGGDMTTLAYLELDTQSGVARFACAGHPPPLLIPRHGSPRFLWGGRSGPLGLEEPVQRVEGEEQVDRGDTIVLYTDGLIERKGESLADGLDRLLHAVADAGGGDDPNSLLDRILVAMLSGHPQEDDVCAIAARLR